jgi:hypothetical protein
LTIAKRFSQQGYLSSEITLIDDHAWPDMSEQLLLSDDTARSFNQNDQEVESTNADVNGRFSLEQEMRRGLQTKRPKPELAILRRGTTFSWQTFGSLY